MSLYRIVGGDVGTRLIFTVREWPIGTAPTPNTLAPIVDLIGASALRLILIPPPGVLTQGASQQTVVASFYTTGADGMITYTTIAGDIPEVPWGGPPQLWQVRPQFTLSGWSGKGEPDSFYVDP